MDNKKKRFKKKKGGKKGQKLDTYEILFSFPYLQREIAPICSIFRGRSKKLTIQDFYSFLTCGGRSKKTEVETDQMKEAQKMEEVEQLAKMIIQSLELLDFLSIYQDSSSGHVSNRLQAL